jgi:hypothetical protein
MKTITINSRSYLVLSAFYEHEDMTTDEMGEYTKLDQGHNGWWCLVGQLNTAGYLERTGQKRLSRAGVKVRVYRITNKGKRLMDELGYGQQT